LRMPPLPADSIHARACKLKCEKILTRPIMRRCTRNIGDIKADFLHESRPKIIWSYYVLSTNVSVLINEKAS